MCAIAREKGVDEMPISLVVHENIHYVSYKMRKGQFLSKLRQKKWLKHAKKLIHKLKHTGARHAMVCLQQKKTANSRRSTLRATDGLLFHSKMGPESCRQSFQRQVQYGLLCHQQWRWHHATPLLPWGLKLNTNGYIHILSEVVKPCIDHVAAGRPYMWQQDSRPSHTSQKTQSWLSENLVYQASLDIWRLGSPDCNPLVFSVPPRGCHQS